LMSAGPPAAADHSAGGTAPGGTSRDGVTGSSQPPTPSASNNPIAARDRLSMLKLLPSIEARRVRLPTLMTGLQDSTNRPAKHSTYCCVKRQEPCGRIEAIPFMRSLDLRARLDDDFWTCRQGTRQIAGSCETVALEISALLLKRAGTSSRVHALVGSKAQAPASVRAPRSTRRQVRPPAHNQVELPGSPPAPQPPMRGARRRGTKAASVRSLRREARKPRPEGLRGCFASAAATPWGVGAEETENAASTAMRINETW
jgi:hypothetical protein